MILTTSFTCCPKCKALYNYTDMVSGNTIGAEFWSDGFVFAPMLYDVIKFTKCGSCGTFFWVQENSAAEPADNTLVTELVNPFAHQTFNNKSIDFLKEAFRSGIVNTVEKEIYMRIKVWQTINHIYRKFASQGLLEKIKQKLFKSPEFDEANKLYNSHSAQKISNLIRLANLMKTDKNELSNYLQFAEIYREAGDFSKAMIFCYKAETASQADSNRIKLLQQHIQNKNKMVYKI